MQTEVPPALSPSPSPLAPERSDRDWIQTFTGRRFFPLRPTIGELSIVDIAHALAMKCRFTGHVSTFYSVAEHSVHCSHRVPREHALWALLHDAAEAYLPDVARPIKGRLFVTMPELPRTSKAILSGGIECLSFSSAEDELLKVIARRFGLPWPMPECVKCVDTEMFATESDALMVQGEEPLQGTVGVARYPELLLPGALGREWQAAKSQFLQRFAELTAE